MDRKHYLYARACGASQRAAKRLAERPELFAAARALREELEGPPMRVIRGGRDMAAGPNPKRDAALATVMQNAMTFLETEGHVDHFDLPVRAQRDLAATAASLAEATSLYEQAMALRAAGQCANEAAADAYGKLMLSAANALVALGHFPYYDDVPELGADRPLQ